MMTWHVRLSFAPREDGGLRVWSEDVPGLVLSHKEWDAVFSDIGPVLKVMMLGPENDRIFPLDMAEPLR